MMQTLMGNDRTVFLRAPMLSRPGSYYYFAIPSGYNNAGTVSTTAASVEAYRIAPAPPPPPPNMPPPPPPLQSGCTLQTPVGLTTAVAQVCGGNPPTATIYNTWWYDACPGVTSHYQFEHSQPVGAPFVPTPGGSFLLPFGQILIDGPDALIQVKACQGAVCGQTSAPVLIHDQC